jgi:hypothetical protein
VIRHLKLEMLVPPNLATSCAGTPAASAHAISLCLSEYGVVDSGSPAASTVPREFARPETTEKGQQGVMQKPLSAQAKRARAQLCEMLQLIHQVNDKEAGEHYEAGDDGQATSQGASPLRRSRTARSGGAAGRRSP